MEEIELIHKRGRREKHFLQKDGTILAKLYKIIHLVVILKIIVRSKFLF